MNVPVTHRFGGAMGDEAVVYKIAVLARHHPSG
jgi:hypothetical protein